MSRFYSQFSKLFLVIVILLAWGFVHVPVASAASCNVSGLITVNTTWGPGSCDPYIVTGNISIQSGATLTIQPGTTIRFGADKAMSVNGGLVAIGTPQSPITFTSDIGTSAGDWGFIYFAPTSVDATYDASGNYTGGSSIQFAVIQYAGDSTNKYAALRIDGASPFINYTTVQFNQYCGIDVQNDGFPKLTNNMINSNGNYGIHIWAIGPTGGTATVSANTVINHTDTGIYLYTNGTGDNANIKKNTISQNNKGMYLTNYSSTGTYMVDQNNVTNNTTIGIDIGLFGKAFTIQNNTISGNQQGLRLAGANGIVKDNTITGNGVGPNYSNGAGIYVELSNAVTIYHNDISNNIGSSMGGGIYVAYASGNPNILYNHITYNSLHSATGQGGGIYIVNGEIPIINNNDIYINTAYQGFNLYNANTVSKPNLNAKNNYWGTTDSNAIGDYIWDYVDDTALGIVDYIPYLNSTPPFPITATMRSVPAQDGWTLESSEASNVGGSVNSTTTTLYLGDNAVKKQYRSILSFSTGATLPDNATITKVILKVQQQGVIGGGNPVSAFQGFMVDIKNGYFGSAAALQVGDFQAGFSKSYGPFNTALVSGWYNIDLTSAKAYINKLATNSGLTQIRLRFKLDDNNNAVANYLSLYSGNAPTANAPQLVITYYLP